MFSTGTDFAVFLGSSFIVGFGSNSSRGPWRANTIQPKWYSICLAVDLRNGDFFFEENDEDEENVVYGLMHVWLLVH